MKREETYFQKKIPQYKSVQNELLFNNVQWRKAAIFPELDFIHIENKNKADFFLFLDLDNEEFKNKIILFIFHEITKIILMYLCSIFVVVSN